MDALNFFIAVTALIIAVLAYQQSARSKDLKSQISSLRELLADTLSKMEKALRKDDKKKEQSSHESAPE